MCRRSPVVLAAAVSLAVGLGSVSVSAEAITGTDGDDVLTGTPGKDTIRGLSGADRITGGRGNDRLHGDAGDDGFLWLPGDGRDRIDGGADRDELSVEVPEGVASLRLHVDALDGGPLKVLRDGWQAVGIKNIEEISISADWYQHQQPAKVTVSADKEVGVNPGKQFYFTINGFRYTNARNVRVPVDITPYCVTYANNVVIGSSEYHSSIYACDSHDRIFTGNAAFTVLPGGGNDIIFVGKGKGSVIFYPDYWGLTRIFNLKNSDHISIARTDPRPLDSNADGWLDARDERVRVRNGNMTIEAMYCCDGDWTDVTTLITLADRTRVPAGTITEWDFDGD